MGAPDAHYHDVSQTGVTIGKALEQTATLALRVSRWLSSPCPTTCHFVHCARGTSGKIRQIYLLRCRAARTFFPIYCSDINIAMQQLNG